jgi:hypothetical protein
MEIEVLVLANKASTTDGLLSVEGAGWEHATPQMLPITIGGYVAGIATFTPAEIDKNPVMTITIKDREDPENPGFSASILIFGARPPTASGVPIREPFAVPFRVPAFRQCVLTASVLDGNKELSSVTFAVRDPIPDAPPTD